MGYYRCPVWRPCRPRSGRAPREWALPAGVWARRRRLRLKEDPSALLVVASNRLPVSVKPARGGLELAPAPGGVAVGLDPLRAEGKIRWVGWPGHVRPSARDEVARRLDEELGCAPVFLPDRLVRLYYNGFCNGTLWPLFHDMASLARFDEAEWKA